MNFHANYEQNQNIIIISDVFCPILYSRDSHILLCFIGISLVRDTASNEAWVDIIIYYCRVSCIKNDVEGRQYQVLFRVHNIFFVKRKKDQRTGHGRSTRKLNFDASVR